MRSLLLLPFIFALSLLTASCAPQVAMNPRERGDSMVSHGFYDAAIYHYTRAITANPNDWQAYSGRARARSHMIDLDQSPADKPGADFPGALADSDRAIALHPEVPQLYLNRGVIRAATGQLNEALADMDHAAKLNPTDGLTHGYRGFVLLRMRRDAEAQAEFDRCEQLAPASRRVLPRYIQHIKQIRGT
jgi:Flp pilus assembly protein TadD